MPHSATETEIKLKYKNAKDVLPEELLNAIQQYADGELLYIPKKTARSAWGEKNGTRNELMRRNRRIACEYKHGKTLDELSDRYCLSSDTLRKIIMNTTVTCCNKDCSK